MLELLQAGRKAECDGFIAKSLNPSDRAALNFRMRPYGFTSPYDTYKATQDYNLRGVAGQIRCPMLITAPVNEGFWPGQSQQLYDLLTSPKKLVPFRRVMERICIVNRKGLGFGISGYSIGLMRR